MGCTPLFPLAAAAEVAASFPPVGFATLAALPADGKARGQV